MKFETVFEIGKWVKRIWKKCISKASANVSVWFVVKRRLFTMAKQSILEHKQYLILWRNRVF